MDTLTHALSGGLIARATAPREQHPDALPLRRRVLVGFAAAAFPDIDVLASYLTPLSYLYHHRGITHSLVLLPLWAALLALVLSALWRFRPGWRAYFGVCAIALATHIAGDLITSFGTMIFAPFSDARFALSATFIIDPWFTGIIVAGLLAAWFWRRTRLPAVAALGVLVGYVTLQWMLQQQAVDFGRDYARAQRIEQATVTAVPRPVSPFNWTVVVRRGDAYRYAHVNLAREVVPAEPTAQTGFFARLDAAYRPLSDALWMHAGIEGSTPEETALAREAYGHPDFRFFRWFAAYPALLNIETRNPESCVWFHDLRFITPGRDGAPFRYGMCHNGDSAWQPFQLVDGERRAVY